ncbi:uncharacterized protein LOC118755071 [Rhagoletis pomonella]|uniref:uncharacterized protein LOC118755071 n=1 Tax=Rhagoletis pomonella TaxID=28610 RepID=UPI00177C4B98|nr:uncharacterized protein LOC118755071 [Rhagoletis pomonella]
MESSNLPGDKGEIDSHSDDEGDVTVVAPGAEMNELREMVRNLQASFKNLEQSVKQQKPIDATVAGVHPTSDDGHSASAVCADTYITRPPIYPFTIPSAGVTVADAQVKPSDICNTYVKFAHVPGSETTVTERHRTNATSAGTPSGIAQQAACPYIDCRTSAAERARPSATFSYFNREYQANSSLPNLSHANNIYSSYPHPSRNMPTPIQPCNQMGPRKLIDLPEFKGMPEEWPLFSTAYKETTATYFYTELENLFRLQKAVKGNARQRVESLLIHPSNVATVMSTLEFCYGRPVLLIRSQIAKARSFPVITEAKIYEIVNLSTMVSNLVAFLESAGATPHLNDPTLLDELVSKLPLDRKEDWIRHKFSMCQLYPSIKEFGGWLQQVAMFVSMATGIVTTDQHCQKFNKNPRTVLTVTASEQICVFCSEEHFLYQCPKFKSAEHNQRWSVVKANRLCFCCLRAGHNLQNCAKRRECGIMFCRKFHHRLLHNSNGNTDEQFNAVKVGNGAEECKAETCKSAVATISTKEQNRNVETRTLLKFLPVRLTGPNGSLNVVAFIDDGAMVSLMEEGVADFLGLKGRTEKLSLKWIGDQTSSELSRQVNVEIVGTYRDAQRFNMKGVRTTKKLCLPLQTLCFEEFTCCYDVLKDFQIENYVDAEPKILIGLPHIDLVRAQQVINFDNGFTLHETKLGWTLFGSNKIGSAENIVGHVCVDEQCLDEMRKEIVDYFNFENFEPRAGPRLKSKADKKADDILQETTKLLGDKYETGLLWKDDDFKFEESYGMALKRLEMQERKMSKDLELKKWYKNKIEEYVSKGYARRLVSEEAACINERTWYLPHFVVYNINKNNKPRLVFDAAAKVNGMSLNCALMKGPEEYQPKPLLSILYKFRQGKIAICGDIREMYHRINIRKEDQNAQRFLWREGNQTKPPDTYIMTAMIFGAICSPCSAQYVKNINAEMYRSEYPRAVEAIINRHYVDDYVDSFDTAEEGSQITTNVISIHAAAGFELRGFVSNSGKMLQSICGSSKTLNKLGYQNMCRGESETGKILGIYFEWKSTSYEKRNVKHDNVGFRSIRVFVECVGVAEDFDAEVMEIKRWLE